MRIVRLLTASAISFLLAGIFLWILLTINGCTTYNLSGYRRVDKYDWWDYETGRLYYSLPNTWKCVQRAEYLSEMLQRAKVNHYVVCGLYKGKCHRWVEIGRKILDPSVIKTNESLYAHRYKIVSYFYQ